MSSEKEFNLQDGVGLGNAEGRKVDGWRDLKLHLLEMNVGTIKKFNLSYEVLTFLLVS